MSTFDDLATAAPSFEVLDEGWEYEFDDEGARGAIRFVVDGPELQPFVDALAGKPLVPVVIGGTTVNRLIPLQHPNDLNIYAHSSRIYPAPGAVSSPIVVGGRAATHSYYLADVRFRTPKWSQGGAYPTVQIARDCGVEMRTRPGAAYQFPSDGLRLIQDVGIPVQCVQYALTFHGLSSLNNDLYDSMVGFVNSTPFFGRPAGTVMYLGCSSTGQFQLGGVPSFEATQRFSYCQVPHRQIMRPDGVGFEAPVRVDNTSKYMFDDADLNQLYA